MPRNGRTDARTRAHGAGNKQAVTTARTTLARLRPRGFELRSAAGETSKHHASNFCDGTPLSRRTCRAADPLHFGARKPWHVHRLDSGARTPESGLMAFSFSRWPAAGPGAFSPRPHPLTTGSPQLTACLRRETLDKTDSHIPEGSIGTDSCQWTRLRVLDRNLDTYVSVTSSYSYEDM